MGLAADAAGGRLRRLSLAASTLVALCVLAFVGALVWQLTTEGTVAIGDLTGDLEAAGIPAWAVITVVTLAVLGAITSRVVLVLQALTARRELRTSGASVAAMVVAAWIWARMIAATVRIRLDEAESARIAALGPEPAPESRYALPLESRADLDLLAHSAQAPISQGATSASAAGTLTATPVAESLPPLPPAHVRENRDPEPAPAAEITESTRPSEPSADRAAPPTADAILAAHAPAAVSAPSGWVLVTAEGERVPLHSPQLTVGRAGRGATADIAVTDPTRTMSKAHAGLHWDGAQWWVKDLGSTNGTHMARGDGTFAPLGSGAAVAVTAAMRLGELVATIEADSDPSAA